MNSIKELETLLGKESVTPYEAGAILEGLAKVLKESKSLFSGMLEGVEHDVKEMANHAKEVINQLSAVELEVEKGETRLYDQYEQMYGRVIKKRREIQERLHEPMPNIQLPYNIKEFVETAERLERLSPLAFERFVAFAQAMNQPKS